MVYYAVKEICDMGSWEQNATLYHKTSDKTIGFGTSAARRIYYAEFLHPVILREMRCATV